ncbi:glycosyltransferase [Lachnospiraceae bacterium WCA-9-b2]|uniref:Glycosyltransferase n=1 Tax=Sporofaciens musculi TaxID=2681861 RepID=A0A7X3MED0_9FIRM|nr:glycosyltransferase [Sporofaciens musculi]
MFDYINSSAIFVMTSNFEGMPNALLEAMALGLPCISTDCPCGGPRSLIETGKNGLLIPVGDIEALEKALRVLLKSPDFADSLGREATLIRGKLDIENIGRQWLEYMSSF